MNFNVYCFSKQYPARLAYKITKSQILLFRRTRNRFWGHSHSFKNCKDQLEKKKSKTTAKGRKEFNLHPALGVSLPSRSGMHTETHLEKTARDRDNESQSEGKAHLFYPSVAFHIKMLSAFRKSYKSSLISHIINSCQLVCKTKTRWGTVLSW